MHKTVALLMAIKSVLRAAVAHSMDGVILMLLTVIQRLAFQNSQVLALHVLS